MFALVEVELSPGKAWYERLKHLLNLRKDILVEEDRSLGIRMLRAKVSFSVTDSMRARERRMQKAFFTLRREGVRGVVLPKDFAYREMARACGLVETDPLALFRRMAPQAALFGADRLRLRTHSLRVGVVAWRISADVEKAMDALCLRARHFVFISGRSGEAYARQLARQWGLSVLLNPMPAQIKAAEIWLVFDSVQQLEALSVSQDALILFLGGAPQKPWARLQADGASYTLPARLRPCWPRGYRSADLLYALWAGGAVGLGEIGIRELYEGENRVKWPPE